MQTERENKTPLAAIILLAMFILLAAGYGRSHAAVTTLKAAAVVREEYDDNIFLSKDQRVFDWITRAVPTIGLTHRTEWWDLSLENTFNVWYYARQHKMYFSDSANLSSKMAVVKNFLYFDLTDVYANVVLEPRRSATDVNFNVNRSDVNTLNASPFIKYDLDPASFVKAGYTYTNIWYRSGSGTNRQSHTGYASLDHKFSPVLEASVGGEYVSDSPGDNVIVHFRANPENPDEPERREVNIGVRDNQAAAYATVIYSFSPATRFDGMGGFRWVRFADNRDKDKAIYNAGLVFGVTGPMKLEFRGIQQYFPSAENGVYVRTQQQVSFQYGFVSPSSTIRAGFFHRDDNYAQIAREDEAFGATAGLELNPGPRTKVNVGGSIEHDKFLPDASKRNLYMGTAGIEYKLTPKIMAGLTYTYNRSTSKTDSDDFFDNHAAFQIRAEL